MSTMMAYQLEFGVKTTPKLLYTLISTPEGLSRWFASNVHNEDDLFYFSWEDSEQKARLIQSKENEFVRFEWLDDFHKGYAFEMQILAGEMASEVSLSISDYAEPAEMDFYQRLWTTQVQRLQRLFKA